MDYLERYTRVITDGTPQRPEYMRYFSARSPKSRDVVHAMNDVSPCTPSLYATGKIDNILRADVLRPFLLHPRLATFRAWHRAQRAPPTRSVHSQRTQSTRSVHLHVKFRVP